MSQKYAFRCQKCGRLHTSDDAAEAPHPHACRVCGAGVVHRHHELAAQLLKPGANVEAVAAEIARCNLADKRLECDNWQVLAKLSPEQLAEFGLTPEQAEPHEPWARGQVPERVRRFHVATASENTGVVDKSGS